MKANLKGLSGIKGLALRHGEKILIAVVGLVAVYFMYSSLKLPRLKDTLQADKLRGLITSTKTAITSSTWPEAGSEAAEEVRVIRPIAKQANAAVEPDKYSWSGFDPPVIANTLLRGDPIVLSAVEVKAYGQTGLLAFQDKDTLEETNRRRQLKEEERQKKEQDRMAEDQEKNQGPGGDLRGRGGAEAGLQTVFDPEHPQRREIQSSGTPSGIPLQGGERLERAYWATIVAKVPIRQQLELFQDAFRNARGYDAARDFPQYVGYQVERREMVGGKPSPWTRVYVYDGQKKYLNPPKPFGKFVNADTVTNLNTKASTEWVGQAVEPVDSRWTDPVLTMILPPLVGRNFGADATHPDIPLAINAPPVEEEVAPAEDPAKQPVEGEDDGSFTAGTGGQQQSPGGGQFGPGRPTMPYGGGEFGGPPGGGFGPRGGFSPGSPEGEFGGMPGGGRMMGGGGGIATGQRTELPREVDFLLLRFFDFSVEPGKEYQYQVRVYIADPNYSIPLESGMLESAVVDRRIKEIQEARKAKRRAPLSRPAEWSEPSSVVGIPIGGTVYVAEAKLPSGKTANDEPVIKLFAETFDTDPSDGMAIHVAQETELRRGSVLNLKGEMKYTGENDRWIDTKDDYALNTGLTVADIDGGDALGKKMTAPSRVLLMDGAGQLHVRDELADKPTVKYLRFVFSDDKRRNQSGMPGGEFGPEGPRGGPGGRGPR